MDKSPLPRILASQEKNSIRLTDHKISPVLLLGRHCFGKDHQCCPYSNVSEHRDSVIELVISTLDSQPEDRKNLGFSSVSLLHSTASSRVPDHNRYSQNHTEQINQ